jgi:hypothetical protein
MIIKTTLLILGLSILTTLPAPAAQEASAAVIEGTQGGIQPQIAYDSSGVIHVVYGLGKEIFYVQSKDSGKTFSKPSSVVKLADLMCGMRRGPRIALNGKTILVTAPTANLLSFVSTDDGKSWSKENMVNDQPKSAREGLHDVVAIPNVGFFATWIDARNGAGEIWGAFSKNGIQWKNRIVYQSPDGSVCQCCHPSVAVSPSGELTVMWRNSLKGSRDMFYAKSSDNGVTFCEGAKLGI